LFMLAYGCSSVPRPPRKVRLPTINVLDKANVIQEGLRLSYPEIGLITGGHFPSGYDHDRNQCIIGEGLATFEKARELIQQFEHFPKAWAFVHSNTIPQQGNSVSVSFYQLGLWWVNGARIIKVIDQPTYYGFSYGTLTNHVEYGEELFFTELLPTSNVVYGIHAYSRPRFWGARLFKPYTRSQQRRFVLESMERMKQHCRTYATTTP
ncbi:MAG: DUF1990 domain-containing protein, partial [Bacteroidota bacterium]